MPQLLTQMLVERRRLPPPLLKAGTHRTEHQRPGQTHPLRRLRIPRRTKGQLPPIKETMLPLPDLKQCHLPPQHHT